MKVVWTEPAVRRLEALRDYLLREAGEAVALEIIEAIVARGDSLRTFADRGRRVPERPELRELVERGRYRIVYRRREGLVEILTVFERHRLLPGEDVPRDEDA